MSQRNEQVSRLALYQELDDIVSAMKNLAQIELHRASRAEQVQKQTFASVAVALNAVQREADITVPVTCTQSILIVVGSERGFCGGFNEQLSRSLQAQEAHYDDICVVGQRLTNRLQQLGENPSGQRPRLHYFAGPTTTDEIQACAQSIMDHLQKTWPPARIELMYHDSQISQVVLLPTPSVPEDTEIPRHYRAYLSQDDLREQLQWHALQQGLIRYLLTSLMQENRLRLQQMEGAREHLEEETHLLRQKINHLRQQEIVEEIEVIFSDNTM